MCSPIPTGSPPARSGSGTGRFGSTGIPSNEIDARFEEIRDPRQTLPADVTHELFGGKGRTTQTCPLLLGDTFENRRFEIRQIENEVIRVLGENAKVGQHLVGEVLQIHRDDRCGSRSNRGRQYVTIIGVG